MKRSKQNYYIKYSESNLANIKNTSKGIKSIISVRSSSSITPTLFTFQNEKFSKITLVLWAKRPSAKEISHIKITLITSQTKTQIPFFLLPSDKEEIKLILSSLDISKATGPYSIPTKYLKLLKNDISD